jgi:hypothetical protein
MTDKVLKSRGRALEESFFARQNEELLQKMRQRAATEARREALAATTGIKDEAVLDRLIELDLHEEGVCAAALVPLIEVAWADGSIQDQERAAILKAAEDAGISQGTVAHELLENWLDQQPDQQLLEVWKDYVGALVESMGPEAAAKLKQDLLGRARSVAEAAGGILGLGSVSKEEKQVLAELEKAFP